MVQPGAGCAEAPSALPRTRAAYACRQDGATLPHGPREGRRALSCGQSAQ